MSKCFAVRLNLALKFQLKILSGFEYMYDALKLQALLSYFVLIDVPTLLNMHVLLHILH